VHELSLAHSVSEIALATLREQALGPGSRVKAVRLRVGDHSGADAEALAFCFEVVRKEWPELAEAELAIQRCPATVRCLGCAAVRELAPEAEGCPACGDPRMEWIGGRELEVYGVELIAEEAES
jgi:hydrogenase nickel incorporation protein HypA/HybF